MSSLGDKAAEKFVASHTANPVVFEKDGLRIYDAWERKPMAYLLTDPHNWV